MLLIRQITKRTFFHPQAKAYGPKLTMANTKNHLAGRKDMSVLMPKNKLRSSQSKTTNQTVIRREGNAKNLAGTLNLVQENQAIKRKKLDGGKSRQAFHLQTMLRARPSNLKTSTKIEQEELEKVPKFKAISLNKKERGAMKVKKYVTELVHKKIKDKRVPPKPEPKHCTKPEPFQLESVARQEEAMRRGMEEIMRTEREEAQRRVFRAQPVIKV
ncbi:unnamed protein product [Cochlearia groenlandica]